MVLTAIFFAGAAAFFPAPSPASMNPPVIYVHGVSESPCKLRNGGKPGNLGDLRMKIQQELRGAFQTRPGATPCHDHQPESNPLNFFYVRDRTGVNDGDVATSGTSQSGVGANARALRDYINTLWDSQHTKVMLVAFSMGGLIVRTYLEQNPDEADARVAAVAFIDSALSGSMLGVAARDASSPFPKLCLGFMTNAGLCYMLMPILRTTLHLDNPNAIAFRDLSPGSDVIRQNAAGSLPTHPAYLTIYGDIHLREHGLGIGKFRLPDSDIPIGDVAVPAGDSNPHHGPDFGGARLQVGSGYNAREESLPYECPFSTSAAAALSDAALLGGPLGGSAAFGLAYESPTGQCILHSPVAHWKVDSNPESARNGSGRSVSDLVMAFLIKTCLSARLGSCGTQGDLVPLVFSAAAQAKLQSFGGPLLVPTLVPRAWGASTADVSGTFARGDSYNLSIAPPLPAGTPASDQAYAVGGSVAANPDNGTPCQPSPYVNGACDVFEARGHLVSVLRTGTSAGWAYSWSECGYSFGVNDTAHVSTNIIRATINSMHVVRGSCAAASSPSGQSAPASCQNVRGYNGVTVTGVGCAEAASVLRNARQGSSTPGWDCHRAGTGPGGGFPVIETCTRGAQIATGSIIDGHA